MMLKNEDDVIHSKALISTAISELEKQQKEQNKLIEQYNKQLKKIEDKPSQMKRSIKAKLNRVEIKLDGIKRQLTLAAEMLAELG